MEPNPEHVQPELAVAVAFTTATTTEAPPYHHEQQPNGNENRKPLHGNRRGPMHIIRVALLMLRSGPYKSKSNLKTLPIVNDVGSRSIWRKLVGSMRPLHLQSNQSPPRSTSDPPLLPPPSPADSENTTDHGDHALSSALSQSQSQSPSPVVERESRFQNSPSSTSSRYASALALNELDQPDEEEIYPQRQKEAIEKVKEEEEENFYDGEGDEMIDAKAEEFIAQFYQQIRLQRLNSMDRRYRAMNQRSLD